MKIDIFTLLKENSHRNVLNIIRSNEFISGAEIARKSGLQPSTIHYILHYLKEFGVIDVAHIGNSTKAGGKPPMLWKINGNTGYILGIELIKNNIRLVMLDFACKEIAKKEIHTLITTEKELEEILFKSITDFLSLSKIKSKLIGIGLAISGLVDNNEQTVVYSRDLNLINYPIHQKLTQQFNVPVVIANDANAGVLGYKWMNDNQKYENLIYLIINPDTRQMGAGLILGHQFYKGKSGLAGEFADKLPLLDDLINSAINKYGKKYPVLDKIKVNKSFIFQHLLEEFKNDCPLSKDVLTEESKAIAHELCRIITFTDSDALIFGGSNQLLNDYFNEFVIADVKKELSEIFKFDVSIPEILFSPYGNYSVAFGAASLILHSIYKNK